MQENSKFQQEKEVLNLTLTDPCHSARYTVPNDPA